MDCELDGGDNRLLRDEPNFPDIVYGYALTLYVYNLLSKRRKRLMLLGVLVPHLRLGHLREG